MVKQTSSTQELFETMPVRKALMTMAVPTIISQLINLVYNTADAIFIGLTGDAYKTAGVTLAFSIFMMTISFSNLFGIGGGSLIARLSGQGQAEKAKSVSAFSFYGAIAIALLYSLIIGLFLNPILNLLGASAQTIGFARQYVLLVVVIGNVPVILSGVTAHLLRNAGYSKQASFGLSMGGVLNIILDPIFMFVLLPAGMEVFGAALATLISNIISCIYLIYKVQQTAQTSPLSIRFQDVRGIGKEQIKSLFGVGIPSASLTALFDLANIFLNALAAAHGDLELAAIGIVMKAERLPNAINIGICQGMLPIVAYNFASGNQQRMHKVISTARNYGLITSAITIVLFEIFSPFICNIFLNTTTGNIEAGLATISLAVPFLRIRCLASGFQFLNYNTSFCMQAVGYGKGTLLHSCVRQLAFYIPFMFILDSLFGIMGLVSAIIAGELCGALFALLIFHRWKVKRAQLS